MKLIPHNPYIVGNPIKTKEMFFGREDDFQFVIRKIGSGIANQIVVFCGERRSGKTSVLFQILNGRVGKKFLPVLIDMQILAGVKSDLDFIKTILELACSTLNLPGLNMEKIAEKAGANSVENYLKAFLFIVKQKFPEKIVLFLLDEYELIEAKIRDGSLGENIIHYLAGILESDYRISFIFTGSTNLENRKEEFWKVLLGKSIYKKISYLSRNDTYRLISEPLAEHIEYPEEIQSAIYRLTGGQPFYTQVVCQNLVDIFMEEERNDPRPEDLNGVVKDIVANPLPQMIYSWNNLSDWTRLILSALGGLIKNSEDWIADQEVYHFLLQSKIRLPFKRERINILLEEAYQKEFLEKNEEEKYRFKMDLFRRWIKKEHSIWKTVKEVKLELKKPLNIVLSSLAVPVALAFIGFVLFFALPAWFHIHIFENLLSVSQNQVKDIHIKSNLAPFHVTIDDTQTLTSEDLEDEYVITVSTLTVGEHVFKFLHPESGTSFEKKITITEDTTNIPVFFTEKEGTAGKTTGKKQTAAAGPLGSIFVSSVPQGASILIDGVVHSVTPQLIRDIPLGEHNIGIVREGYKTEYFKVEIVKNEILEKNIVLTATYGQLLLDVKPTAKIYLDGKYLIDTPYAKPISVATGKHVLTIENESLNVKKSISIVINEGEEISIKEDLKK
jgi:hypothetical protein